MLASSRIDSQARHIRALVGGAVGDFCSANNDCVLGQCDNGVCVDAPKVCPQKCLGRGVCTKLNVNDEVMDEDFVCLMRSYCKVICGVILPIMGLTVANFITSITQTDMKA